MLLLQPPSHTGPPQSYPLEHERYPVTSPHGHFVPSHFTPWSFRPQSLRFNQKSVCSIIEVTLLHVKN